jgi:hypothetical protein
MLAGIARGKSHLLFSTCTDVPNTLVFPSRPLNLPVFNSSPSVLVPGVALEVEGTDAVTANCVGGCAPSTADGWLPSEAGWWPPSVSIAVGGDSGFESKLSRRFCGRMTNGCSLRHNVTSCCGRQRKFIVKKRKKKKEKRKESPNNLFPAPCSWLKFSRFILHAKFFQIQVPQKISMNCSKKYITSSLLMNACRPPWDWKAAMSMLVIRSITRTARVTNWKHQIHTLNFICTYISSSQTLCAHISSLRRLRSHFLAKYLSDWI